MDQKTRGFINVTLPAGWTYEQVQDELDRRCAEYGILPDYRDPSLNWKKPAPRGRVLFGTLVQVQHELDISLGRIRPPAEEDKRLLVIKTLLDEGKEPGKTIKWKSLAEEVRKRCGAPPDARGFDPRTIRRLVKKAKLGFQPM
jgi:hypothetical protein